MRKGTGKGMGRGVGGGRAVQPLRTGAPSAGWRSQLPAAPQPLPTAVTPQPPAPHGGVYAAGISRGRSQLRGRAAPPSPPLTPHFPPGTPRPSPSFLPLVRPQRSSARPSPSAALRRRYFLLKGPRPALRFFLLKGPRCAALRTPSS